MSIWKRIKTLWALSNFEITEFDNKLCITKQNDELVYARPVENTKTFQPAQIIKLRPKDEIEEILKNDE
jgi:hypothetical protein